MSECFAGDTSLYASPSMFYLSRMFTNPKAEVLLIGAEVRQLRGLVAANRCVMVVDESAQVIEDRVTAPMLKTAFKDVIKHPFLRLPGPNPEMYVFGEDLKVCSAISVVAIYDIVCDL